MDAEKILKKAIKKYGVQNQLLQACEELGELIQAISKYNRKGAVMKDALTEEIADVLIMIWQIQLIADIDNGAVWVREKGKLDRLDARLEAMEAKP